MQRRLFILSAVSLFLTGLFSLAQAQVPLTGAGKGRPAADSAAATNLLARTTGLDAAHIAAYKALLNGLTADGIFNSDGTSNFLDALYIWATQDQTTADLNL